MNVTKWFASIVGVVLVSLAGGTAAFGGIDSGNELARRLMSSQKGQEKEMEKDATGNIYFFRYMRVSDKKAVTNGPAVSYEFKALEPSSGMYVEFVVKKKESLKIAEVTQPGEALALIGRIKTISKASSQIVLDTPILRYKDRAQPVKGKELLSDVDPNARLGTDTTTGEENVIKSK